MKDYQIKIIINGKKYSGKAKPEQSLLNFLRENGFTEVKSGCGKGECGTCTVIMNSKAIKSCLTLAMQADGKEIITVKELKKIPLGKKLQDSFIEHGAIQCGFCTPGMLLVAKAYLDENPEPNKAEISRAISGNLCRCTGYQKIVNAIYEVAVENQKKEYFKTKTW
jgi:carbon-monoxide dehydrogenase small subunit